MEKEEKTYKEIRCIRCRKLILKVSENTTGILHIKCKRCKKEFEIKL